MALFSSYLHVSCQRYCWPCNETLFTFPCASRHARKSIWILAHEFLLHIIYADTLALGMAMGREILRECWCTYLCATSRERSLSIYSFSIFCIEYPLYHTTPIQQHFPLFIVGCQTLWCDNNAVVIQLADTHLICTRCSYVCRWHGMVRRAAACVRVRFKLLRGVRAFSIIYRFCQRSQPILCVIASPPPITGLWGAVQC